MKKEIISFDLKKSTLFVFKSKKGKSMLGPTVTDPTNGTATSHTSSVVITTR